MARRKALSLDEQLENITKDINETEIHLQKLKEEKRELEVQIKQRRLEEIDRLILTSGKTLDDVVALLAAC